jgi:drug/metabolite transporter (DMT)-like permease
MLILASICTAYFTASVKVMKKLSPYTVMLTTNLEPVYGIILVFIIGGKEKMSFSFYVGAVIIIITVILNGIIKHKAGKNSGNYG